MGNNEWQGHFPDLIVCEHVGAIIKDRVESLILEKSAKNRFWAKLWLRGFALIVKKSMLISTFWRTYEIIQFSFGSHQFLKLLKHPVLIGVFNVEFAGLLRGENRFSLTFVVLALQGGLIISWHPVYYWQPQGCKTHYSFLIINDVSQMQRQTLQLNKSFQNFIWTLKLMLKLLSNV